VAVPSVVVAAPASSSEDALGGAADDVDAGSAGLVRLNGVEIVVVDGIGVAKAFSESSGCPPAGDCPGSAPAAPAVAGSSDPAVTGPAVAVPPAGGRGSGIGGACGGGSERASSVAATLPGIGEEGGRLGSPIAGFGGGNAT